ncbi:MAG: prolipoprotein diacylglyceryl transferase [Desulfobacterales bacterium]|nr:prolipoprotein diacylglyceryl transferase [Desulfobacterales bacterium]
MYPTLLNLGKFTIYTYGFFLAMGFLAGIFLAKHEAKRVGEDPDKILDLAFYILIAAIVGSRIFYVATNLKAYLTAPLEIFKIWNGGLVFYGGFIAAFITALIYMRIKNMPVWKTTDIMAPPLALGQTLGRLGCFFAGCCYGEACELPWAVTFTRPDTLAPIGISIHPTQLYSALSNFIIFIFLFSFRKKKKFEGQLFWTYVFLYGVTRSIIEIFRGDFRGELVFNSLSISQATGCVMAILAVIMIVYLRGKQQKL